MMNLKLYCVPKYKTLRSLFILWSFLLLLSTLFVHAWDKSLIDAAIAVYKDNATQKQLGMVLSRNYEINLMAMRGEIKNGTFQTSQHEFIEVSTEIVADVTKPVLQDIILSKREKS